MVYYKKIDTIAVFVQKNFFRIFILFTFSELPLLALYRTMQSPNLNVKIDTNEEDENALAYRSISLWPPMIMMVVEFKVRAQWPTLACGISGGKV